ncbi:MAG: hypothetical protein JSS76_14725 [Bacteroidetes bacterium]|nr:hypothetical protein [Bacteroidota bacterium]
MQVPVIKQLAETHSIDVLRAAEDAIINEQTPAIEIQGKDEGEQLTHVLAAIEILNDMAKSGIDFRTALRNYTQRVRNSIS